MTLTSDPLHAVSRLFIAYISYVPSFDSYGTYPCQRYTVLLQNLSVLLVACDNGHIHVNFGHSNSPKGLLTSFYLSAVGAVVQLVEYRTRNQEVAGSTHTRFTASNLEQVDNLLCAQANSASYPQRDGK